MKTIDLDKKSAAQLDSLAVWTAKARTLVLAKVSDAKAHAVVALTDTLKRTPDGRPTLRKAARGPSYGAACHRLVELWSSLAGPSTASLDGLVRDARAGFYRDAVGWWKPTVPAEFRVRRDAAEYDGANVRAARGLVLHGMELRREVGAPIERARRTLLATLGLAAGRSTPTRVRSDLLDVWARKSADSIGTAVRLALSDSLTACDSMALRDLVRPEFRDEHVAVPGGV